MKLYNHATGIYLESEDIFYALPAVWDSLINRQGLGKYLQGLIPTLVPVRQFDPSMPMLPPIGRQEIWAAGVTYLRSKDARNRRTPGVDLFTIRYMWQSDQSCSSNPCLSDVRGIWAKSASGEIQHGMCLNRN
jgi:hypothetical protein